MTLDQLFRDLQFEEVARQILRGEVDTTKPLAPDFLFAYRLLLGRWPQQADLDECRKGNADRSLGGLVKWLMESQEFRTRMLQESLALPAEDCVVMTETPSGLRFFFSLLDKGVGLPLATGGFEPDVDPALTRLLKPGLNCLDVGANIGYYTVRMAAVAKQAGGRVFSFEPSPRSHALLLKNLRENGLEDCVQVFQVACGEEDGEAFLVPGPDPRNPGQSHLSDALGAAGVGERVAVRRVDGMIPEDVRVDLVKIDVEGYEPRVLLGMDRILSENRPIILTEFHTAALEAEQPEAPSLYLAGLAQAGYVVYEAWSFAQGNFDEYRYVPGAAPTYANLVCLPKTASPENPYAGG